MGPTAHQAYGAALLMSEAVREILGHYRVDFGERLDGLDSAGARAYAASDTLDAKRDLYALVQDRSTSARGEVLVSLLESGIPSLVRPIDVDVCAVPSDGEAERMVTIVERPTGGALSGHWKSADLSADKFVKETFLRGAAKALMELNERDLTHRAIRPDNVFLSSDPDIGVVLGDCFSSPPGSGQADVYEPLARSIADQDARGEGDESADMFALGATLLALYTDKIPGDGRSRQEVYHARLSQGSFWAYVGGRELPGAIATVLRNLLNDDPTERWTLSDLNYWLEGQTPRKLSGFANWSLSRPVTFMAQTYSDRRMLAEVFATNVPEAAAYLKDRDYPAWIQQVVASENFTDRLLRLLATELDPADKLRSSDDAMLAKYCMFLDPHGPVRYKGTSTPFDGMGQALASAQGSGDELRVKAIEELFSSALIANLLEISEENNPVANPSNKKIGPAARVAKSKSPGMGLERLLYDLNPSLPCQTDRYRNAWVNTIGSALRALDQIMATDVGGGELFDKHFMAFCASKEKSLEGVFEAMGRAANDPARGAVLTLELLADMQSKHNAGPLPNLCRRASAQLKPIIDSLRNNRTREAIRAQIESLSEGGDIKLLARTLNMAKLQSDDKEGFRAARATYAQLARERVSLERGVQASDPKAENYGYFGALSVGVAVLGFSALMFVTGL